MAALGYQYGNIRFLCAGSLITTAGHILTAGHCIKDNLVLARLGARDINAEGVDIGIGLKIVHENFDPKTIANDIGIAKLVQSIQTSIAIRPVCLPYQLVNRDLTYFQPFVAGEDFSKWPQSFLLTLNLIVGWGSISFKGPTARILQEAQLPILPQSECAFNYRLYFPDQVFDERVMCAGFSQGGRDSKEEINCQKNNV